MAALCDTEGVPWVPVSVSPQCWGRLNRDSRTRRSVIGVWFDFGESEVQEANSRKLFCCLCFDYGGSSRGPRCKNLTLRAVKCSLNPKYPRS